MAEYYVVRGMDGNAKPKIPENPSREGLPPIL